MVCILKMNWDRNITRWVIATGLLEARRSAEAAGDDELADHLFRLETLPKPGKYPLPGGYILLVS